MYLCICVFAYFFVTTYLIPKSVLSKDDPNWKNLGKTNFQHHFVILKSFRIILNGRLSFRIWFRCKMVWYIVAGNRNWQETQIRNVNKDKYGIVGAANTEWGEITELQKATELDTICCNDTICSNCNENVDEKLIEKMMTPHTGGSPLERLQAPT